MRSQSFLMTLVAPASVIGAVITPQGQINLPTTAGNSAAASPVFGVMLFKGNNSGPCNDLGLEMAFQEGTALDSTNDFCFSTKGLATTCIGRRTKEDPGPATNAQAYEAASGGIDTKPYQCTVTGYQQDGCPTGTGAVAQYQEEYMTWAWDHETRIRDDFPGSLWSVLSFRMSCKP